MLFVNMLDTLNYYIKSVVFLLCVCTKLMRSPQVHQTVKTGDTICSNAMLMRTFHTKTGMHRI